MPLCKYSFECFALEASIVINPFLTSIFISSSLKPATATSILYSSSPDFIILYAGYLLSENSAILSNSSKRLSNPTKERISGVVKKVIIFSYIKQELYNVLI